MTKCICYHGTTEENARCVLQEGFHADTWFARHLEDALEFGGEYVFSVEFDVELIPDDWQFHVLSRVPVEKIQRCQKIVKGRILYSI